MVSGEVEVIWANEPNRGMSVYCAGSWQPAKRPETASDANSESENRVFIMVFKVNGDVQHRKS